MEFIMTTDLATAMPKEIGYNHEELKAELAQRLEHYKNLVVTEDTIKDGKEEKARLNKLRSAIEDRRKEGKKTWAEPNVEFEKKVKELVQMIDEPIAIIDGQLKVYEEKRKQEKQQLIEELYGIVVPDEYKGILNLERIFDQKWLNATTKMSKVDSDLNAMVKRVGADMLVLETVEPEYKAAVRAEYMRTLDIEIAMNHRKQLQDAAAAFKRSETEQAKQTPNEEPEREKTAKMEPYEESKTERIYSLRLEFQLTRNQATALKRFLENNNISYHKI